MAERIAEIYNEQGELIGYEYSDGAKRKLTGGFLERPPYASPMITKDNASELAKKRWDDTSEAFDRGIASLVEAGGSLAIDEQTIAGIERIATAQAKLAVNTDAGHASTKAAEFLLRAADRLPDRRQAAPQAVVAIQVNISPELAASEWQEDE